MEGQSAKKHKENKLRNLEINKKKTKVDEGALDGKTGKTNSVPK